MSASQFDYYHDNITIASDLKLYLSGEIHYGHSVYCSHNFMNSRIDNIACGRTMRFFIDLRTAQVYWDAIFLVSQEVYLNFHHFCG